MSKIRLQKPQRSSIILIAMLTATVMSGCSTRQVVKKLDGSTAQRLVTYSLDQFIEDLTQQPEVVAMKGQSVKLGVHFLSEHQLIEYATSLIAAELQLTQGIKVVDSGEAADFEMDVYFNSLGTDSDNFGLTLPTLGLSPAPTVHILALDMYHGITEGYAIIKTASTGRIQKTERMLARIRRDNVSTPVFDFPVNQLED